MKLSELLYKYATETAQTQITRQNAEQFLKTQRIENKVITNLKKTK